MFKKFIDLQTQLQAEQQTLASELQALQTITDEPEPSVFDELRAAKQIAAAKSADHLEGTQTADAIGKAIDKERADAAKLLAAFSKKKAEALQKLAIKKAQLTATESELASVNWRLKEFINQAAGEQLKLKTEAYRNAVVSLLNALIDIDALSAIIADQPNESPAKAVLLVKTLPKVGLENEADVGPWRLQENGEKLIFTSDMAVPAVHRRYLDLIEEMKGSLYEH